MQAVLWLRWLVTGLSLQMPGSVHMGLVVDKVAPGQVLLSEFFSFSLSVSFYHGSASVQE
jgi:hypothetical protein